MDARICHPGGSRPHDVGTRRNPAGTASRPSSVGLQPLPHKRRSEIRSDNPTDTVASSASPPARSPSSKCRSAKDEPHRQRTRNNRTTQTTDARRSTPSANPSELLALRDLYTQVPEQTSSLRRFGSDAFLHHGLNSNEMVTDLPVGPDYILGPGDSVILSLWGSVSQTLSRVVDHEGRLSCLRPVRSWYLA